MFSGNLQIKLAAKITLPALPTPRATLCHSCVLVAMASLACSGLPPTPPMLFQCFNDYGYRFLRRALTPTPPMPFLRFNDDGIFSLQRCLTPHAHHPFPVLQRRWLPPPSSRSHPPHPPMSFLRFNGDGCRFLRHALTPRTPLYFSSASKAMAAASLVCTPPHAPYVILAFQRRWLPLPSSCTHPPHPPMSFLRFNGDGLFFCLVIFVVLAWLLLGVVCLGWMGFFYFLAGGWLASLAA